MVGFIVLQILIQRVVTVNVMENVHVIMYKHILVLLKPIRALNVRLIRQRVLVIIRYVSVMDMMREHVQVSVIQDTLVHALVMVLFVHVMVIVLDVVASAIMDTVVHVAVMEANVAVMEIVLDVADNAIVDIINLAAVMVVSVVVMDIM